MIDHVALNLSDHAASKSLYEQSLAPLGYGVVMDYYGALVLDSDGNNVEAVCHRPQ